MPLRCTRCSRARRRARFVRPRLDGVRLGRLTGYFEAVLEPAVRTAYEAAVDRLVGAGVRMTEVTLPHATDLAAIYLHIVLPEAAALARIDARTRRRSATRRTCACGSRWVATSWRRITCAPVPRSR